MTLVVAVMDSKHAWKGVHCMLSWTGVLSVCLPGVSSAHLLTTCLPGCRGVMLCHSLPAGPSHCGAAGGRQHQLCIISQEHPAGVGCLAAVDIRW